MGKALRISLSKSCCILKAIKTAACGASGLQAAVFYIVTWASVFTYSTDCMICA